MYFATATVSSTLDLELHIVLNDFYSQVDGGWNFGKYYFDTYSSIKYAYSCGYTKQIDDSILG